MQKGQTVAISLSDFQCPVSINAETGFAQRETVQAGNEIGEEWQGSRLPRKGSRGIQTAGIASRLDSRTMIRIGCYPSYLPLLSGQG
jgi:hypothetical protein